MRFTLLSDGASDQALIPILMWALRETGVTANLQGQWADLRNLRIPPVGLFRRIEKALELYPCELLFVHRDSEGQPADLRRAEINEALCQLAEAGGHIPHVCVVTVRMQEAWLLFDEVAIRTAAGNPNGTVALPLPSLLDVEGLPDPKQVLFNLLRAASELHGRRLMKFSAPKSRLRIAELIDDFSPLRELAAFQIFETELAEVTQGKNWQ
jgi:hypothetical protein